MKVNDGKTIEVIKQNKVNIDEQQNYIKDLKEQWNKDDNVQEISGAGNPMKKNKSLGEKKIDGKIIS